MLLMRVHNVILLGSTLLNFSLLILRRSGKEVLEGMGRIFSGFFTFEQP